MSALSLYELLKVKLDQNLGRFRTVKMWTGKKQLTRSLIPKDESKRYSFYVDQESSDRLKLKAAMLNLTDDELLRHAIWELITD